MNTKRPTILNRKARHEYHILDTYVAGIALTGTEVKSIRDGKAQLAEAYCYFKGEELFVKKMRVSPYKHGNIFNVDPDRERKLLLKKRELQRLKAKLEEKGLTILPLKLFFNERNYVKLELGLAKGKKLYDKREDIKKRDSERALRRDLNV